MLRKNKSWMMLVVRVQHQRGREGRRIERDPQLPLNTYIDPHPAHDDFSFLELHCKALGYSENHESIIVGQSSLCEVHEAQASIAKELRVSLRRELRNSSYDSRASIWDCSRIHLANRLQILPSLACLCTVEVHVFFASFSSILSKATPSRQSWKHAHPLRLRALAKLDESIFTLLCCSKFQTRLASILTLRKQLVTASLPRVSAGRFACKISSFRRSC
mmetsp:Transcript_68520/g.127829  ORF Transcript_68520/g.127829 Transcript_68520/m.127829 type:complete len:219 (-) Transcript_68520:101-757(-)